MPINKQENMFKFKSKNESPKSEEKPKGEGLRSKLRRSRAQWGDRLRGLFSGAKIDDELFEELETLLLTADVGTTTTMKVMDLLQAEVKRTKLTDGSALQEALVGILAQLLV